MKFWNVLANAKGLSLISHLSNNVNCCLNAKNLEIIEIKSFEDIIDIEEEFKSPIMFYEHKEN